MSHALWGDMMKCHVSVPPSQEDLYIGGYRNAKNTVAHNWSIGGRTCHITTKINFLCELKEQGILIVCWIPTTANTSDLFTKNLNGPDFEWQTAYYVGIDEYVKNKKQEKHEVAQGENVRNCD
jgi:hypothetical protein